MADEEPIIDEDDQEKKTWFVRYFIIMPEKSTMKQLFDAFIFAALALNYFLAPFTLAFDSVPQVTSA